MPSWEHIVGRWSEDTGYLADLSRDTILDFHADGSMSIENGGERIGGCWESDTPGKLVLITHNGHRYGPFNVRVERRDLPLGQFDVLESDGALLPFDRRRFSRAAPGGDRGGTTAR